MYKEPETQDSFAPHFLAYFCLFWAAVVPITLTVFVVDQAVYYATGYESGVTDFLDCRDCRGYGGGW